VIVGKLRQRGFDFLKPLAGIVFVQIADDRLQFDVCLMTVVQKLAHRPGGEQEK